MAQGANVRHLQWDLAAEVVFLFWRKEIMQHASCSGSTAAAKCKVKNVTFVSL